MTEKRIRGILEFRKKGPEFNERSLEYGLLSLGMGVIIYCLFELFYSLCLLKRLL